MKFENTSVWGFEHALRGMRNPKESWARSDSTFENGNVVIGPNDMKLAQTLIRGGSEHRKFLRQIFVSVDIEASLFWFKEFDTYKVATVANSTSTMHKLTSKPITLQCFEIDDFGGFYDIDSEHQKTFEESEEFIAWTFDDAESMPLEFIDFLEDLRQKYLLTKDKRYWKELVRWLPESWLQTRTVTMNYETILTMCKQRRTHKLNEWSGLDDNTKPNFIAWARSLPYAQEFLFLDEESENGNN